MALYKINLT